MKITLQKVLISIHFITLSVAIINAIANNTTIYSLESSIKFGVEIVAFVSGVILFFQFLKPFRIITIYFSLYAIVGLFTIIGMTARHLFCGIFMYIFLNPVIPDIIDYESNGITITRPHSYAARCCQYQVKQRTLLLFEKRLCQFETDGIMEFTAINISPEEIVITYLSDSGEGEKTKTISIDNNK